MNCHAEVFPRDRVETAAGGFFRLKFLALIEKKTNMENNCRNKSIIWFAVLLSPCEIANI